MNECRKASQYCAVDGINRDTPSKISQQRIEFANLQIV